MAKICAAFYNAVFDENDEEKIPCWYETFFNGLKAFGNELLLLQTGGFQQKCGREIDETLKNRILDFAPDLYISFNNVFPDMDILECPKIVYEADTPIYWSNKDRLKYNRDNLFFVWGDAEKQYLQECFGIKSNRIYKIRPFTAIRKDERKQSIDISFIGSRFGIDRKNEMGYLAEKDINARNDYYKCLAYVVEHPYASKEELIRLNGISNKTVLDMIDIPGMLMMMSAEMRVRVLSSVVDLGLRLYGTDSWMYRYHFDTRLNTAYVNKAIYSLQHNQEIYNNSKIAINISHYQAKDCFSWRVLDIMASNACLVTDAWSGVKRFFPQLNIPVYKDEHHARELCKELLRNESYRRDIVAECNHVIDENYRFIHHITELEGITGLKMSKMMTR